MTKQYTLLGVDGESVTFEGKVDLQPIDFYMKCYRIVVYDTKTKATTYMPSTLTFRPGDELTIKGSGNE